MAKRPARAMPLSPIHPSMYGREGSFARTPGDLTKIKLPEGATEVLQRQSLDIFTIMANAGYPFADCLAAILLTGINWDSKALDNDDQMIPS